jgi:broad specificity phosphatase PhoE
MSEMTLDGLIAELKAGSRVALQLRHAERPKLDPNDPSFGDILPITAEGVRTSLELGRRLSQFKDVVRFVSSPLRRTQMTASAVAEGMEAQVIEIPTDELLGNGSFYYTDPEKVLEVMNAREFFSACTEYYTKGILPGFAPLGEAADACERWLLERLDRQLLVATTHDVYIAAFLAARGVVESFSRDNWPRFLDGAAIIVEPGGARRYEFVRTGLSTGIVGVAQE